VPFVSQSPVSISSKTPIGIVTSGLKLGGTTTFLINLGKEFRKRGLQLPLICLSDENEMSEDLTESGILLSCIDSKRLIYEDRLSKAHRIMRDYSPRIVISALGHASFEFLRIVPSCIGRYAMIQTDESGVYQALRDFVPWLDGIIGVSSQIVAELGKQPEFSSIKKIAIPYGIDFGEEQSIKERCLDGPLQLIYVGRLIEEQKRVSRLLELAKGLQQAGIPFDLHIIGSGPEEGLFRNPEAESLGINWHGSLPNGEIREHLMQTHLFVLLSDYEGLPLALLEAMGEGVVPVVSDLPSGISEVVDDDSGVRLPIGDISKAVERIAYLDKNRTSMNSMGEAARLKAHSQFSAALMADRYLDLLAEWPTGSVWCPSPSVSPPMAFTNNPLFREPWRVLRRSLKMLGNTFLRWGR